MSDVWSARAEAYRDVPEQREPRPMPGSSETIVTSTSPSRSLVPTVDVTVARTRPPEPTQPKSAIDQPGLIGQGR